jgi:hypothetical protein
MTPQEIIRFIESRRWPISDEKALQAMMAKQFAAAGVAVRREMRLSDQDIVDFMVDHVAIEVKIKGQRREHYRQCERYCMHDQVHALVLATAKMMGLPPTINGKPVFTASLSRGWL